MVLTVSFVLSPVTGSLSPSSLRSLLLKNLTPTSGRQNHTTSPSTSRAVRQKRLGVHRIPTFVTMANAPREGQDHTDKPVIWVKRKQNYFCKQGWTAKSPDRAFVLATQQRKHFRAMKKERSRRRVARAGFEDDRGDILSKMRCFVAADTCLGTCVCASAYLPFCFFAASREGGVRSRVGTNCIYPTNRVEITLTTRAGGEARAVHDVGSETCASNCSLCWDR
jgi:hypothetical protein